MKKFIRHKKDIISALLFVLIAALVVLLIYAITADQNPITVNIPKGLKEEAEVFRSMNVD